jgi:hypothetical protein
MKLMDRFDRYIDDFENKEEIRDIVSSKIFTLLNRANAQRNKKSTSPLTAMYANKPSLLMDLFEFSTHSIKNITSDELFSSFTGMQNGK